ncbi:integral membrane protein [Trypanosoma grayi]|uniref:integral membrane protein n=1 Tax=Trypanosoma grayi TaxID=71804 RepID=UPI0004F4B92A|nr:integral membrane protein [Trypanosoma grayi]KEG09295.1 integral membrane protein [Trypanosoma grayi]
MDENSRIRVWETTTGYKSTARAIKAYRERDVEMSRLEHQKPLPHAEYHSSTASDYIKSVVFGGLDGIMTTFAIVAAAVGSNSTFASVLIFGFSNVIADGFSMGFGEYVSGEAERENARAERRREEWEVENAFDMEVDEMVQIYEAKGLSHEDATTIVNIISKDPKLFVDFMMTEELGLILDLSDLHGPKKQGVVMFASFLIFGTIPLLAYVPGKGKGVDGVFVASCLLATCALVVLGSIKGYLTGINMMWSAALMVFNGVISGIVSFSVGLALERLLSAEIGDAV